MQSAQEKAEFFETGSVWKILIKLSPPVMAANLITGLYNVVDSYFIGKYSNEGLTALSVIFPLQLIIFALGIGTGVGVNTQMSAFYAKKRQASADNTAGTGQMLIIITWAIFSLLSLAFMRLYVSFSASTPEVMEAAVSYGNIVCVGSLPLLLELIWEKVHQSYGSMMIPTIGQITGAVVNIILDPVLIFGWGDIPEMGVTGAAIATVIGQCFGAIITFNGGWRRIPGLAAMKAYAFHIYKLGFPSIVMQSLYTVYIYLLNVILAGFCDEAITVLGLYYKLQAFFWIPLFAMQTCIVPVLSYNYEKKLYDRCHKIFIDSLIFSAILMLVGFFAFEFWPAQLIGLFSNNQKVFDIGIYGFKIIGLSFIPAVISLTYPVYFQAIGKGWESVFISVLRQLICLVPIFWAFSFIGLSYTWLAFPVSEVITSIVGYFMYKSVKNRS